MSGLGNIYPGDVDARWFERYGFVPEDQLGQQSDVSHAMANRPTGDLDRDVPRCCSRHTRPWHAVCCWTYTVEPIERCWCADATTYVGTGADWATSKREQGSISTRGASRAESRVSWVRRATEDVIIRFEKHACLWHVVATIEDCASRTQERDHAGVCRSDVVCPRDILVEGHVSLVNGI